MTTPDHIMPPPVRDTGPLETMARAIRDADAAMFGDLGESVPKYYFDRSAEAITALTEAGYAIVPVEPTEAMLEQGRRGGDIPYAAEVWDAMIQVGRAT